MSRFAHLKTLLCLVFIALSPVVTGLAQNESSPPTGTESNQETGSLPPVEPLKQDTEKPDQESNLTPPKPTQTETEDDADAVTIDNAPIPATLVELNREIRNNENEINRLYASMPIRMSEKTKQYQQRIDALTRRNELLLDRQSEVAENSFTSDPVSNGRAAQIIFGNLKRALDPRGVLPFQPEEAHRLATLLIDAKLQPEQFPPGINEPNLLYQDFRACYALNEFEVANQRLNEIKQLGIQLQAIIPEQLADASKKWEQEALIRRQEASNDDLPRVQLETTEGTIVVELFENHAPQTVANFISLVEKNFYNDLDFFMVKPGEFARTGCTKNNGTSNPGYVIENELGREQIRYHFAGTLSMHHDEALHGGSQFYILHQPLRRFDQLYTAFGRVIEGMDVVYQLNNIDMTKSTLGSPSKIIKATVLRKRDHEYKPVPLNVPDNSLPSTEQGN